MELINEDLIKVNADLKDKDEVLNTISDLLASEGRLLDQDLYLKDVYEREETEPTALGFSFAIPHAKSKGVKEASLVFIELKNELLWTGNEKIKYVFGIAVPHDKGGNEHLDILSMLARKMMKDEFRKSLIDARKKGEYLDLIKSD